LLSRDLQLRHVHTQMKATWRRFQSSLHDMTSSHHMLARVPKAYELMHPTWLAILGRKSCAALKKSKTLWMQCEQSYPLKEDGAKDIIKQGT